MTSEREIRSQAQAETVRIGSAAPNPYRDCRNSMEFRWWQDGVAQGLSQLEEI